MSYAIVKSIKIDKKNKKVYVTSTSNNVYPKIYRKWENTYLTEIFKESDIISVIKEILYDYYSGNFQPGNQNIYSTSLFLLDRKKYNWENSSNFTEEELKEVLYTNYLTIKSEPKGEFIVYIPDENVYVTRFTARRAYTTRHKEYARVYSKKSTAELLIQKYKKGALVILDKNEKFKTT